MPPASIPIMVSLWQCNPIIRWFHRITIYSIFQLHLVIPVICNLSRSIIGNEQLGYKIAICQRDLAMYSSLFLTGLVFSATGKKWLRIPLWIWVILGVLPLGIDGLSQLAGHYPFYIDIFLLRESTPLLRDTHGHFIRNLHWTVFISCVGNESETKSMTIHTSHGSHTVSNHNRSANSEILPWLFHEAWRVQPFALGSLNMATSVGDSRENVIENRQTIRQGNWHSIPIGFLMSGKFMEIM